MQIKSLSLYLSIYIYIYIYIYIDYNSQKEFEFNEKTKEIVWSGPDAEDKWIEGCFC